MSAPSPLNRELNKILRLIGALIIAISGLVLLNALIGPEAPAGNRPDVRTQRMELPASMPPAHQNEA